MDAFLEGAGLGERWDDSECIAGAQPEYDRAPWVKMPLAELTTYTVGRVCASPKWWAVTNDGHVLFFQNYGSPQCNVTLALLKRIRPGMRYEFIARAFVPQIR